MKVRLAVVVGAVLLAVVSVSAVGVAWNMRHRRHQADKAGFLEKYQAAMESEIRRHFFMFEELPTHASELTHTNSEIRQPWVLDGVVEFGWNRPSLDEGWEAFEREIFPTCLSLAIARIPEWSEELKAAREPLLQRAPDLESQLDLFADLDFDYHAGYRCLADLPSQRGVQEQSLVAFVESLGKARDAKMFGPLMEDADIAQALAEFEKAKAMVIAEVQDHDCSADTIGQPN